MANQNKPAGLSPVMTLSGSPWTGKGNLYYIASDNATVFWPGDLVDLTGESDAHGIPGIALATAGNPAVGVFMGAGISPFGGMYADPGNLDTVGLPATKTKAYYAYICDDPNVIYEIQEIGTGTLLTAAAVGLNADIVYAAPATGVKVSGTQLNNVGEATTSTLNCKILRLAPRIDNALGQYQKWLVMINNHRFRAGVTGV